MSKGFVRAKRDIMDPPPEFDNGFDRFKYWFVNVFWFHYKWVLLTSAIILTFAIGTLVSVLTHRNPDIVVVAVSMEALSYEHSEALQTELAEYIGDRNGDGSSLAEIQLINLGDEMTGPASLMLLAALAQRDDVVLFLMDGNAYEELQYSLDFINIAEYFPGNESIIDVSSFDRIRGFSPHYENPVYYAGFANNVAAQNREYVELSVEALKFLMGQT